MLQRNEEVGRAACAELENTHGAADKVLFIQCDITDKDELVSNSQCNRFIGLGSISMQGRLQPRMRSVSQDIIYPHAAASICKSRDLASCRYRVYLTL